MPYMPCELPAYPCERDVWDSLREEKRPIVVYGMGDGADKLLRRFDALGIEVADFFASDGFVRGQIFHGKRVCSLAEIRSKYPEFLVVLAFASNKPDVVSMLAALDREVDLVAPDMPVAGEEYSDRAFYNEHYDRIFAAYNALSDGDSRALFAAVITYRLTGRIAPLLSAYSTRDELYACLPCEKISSVADLGAYNGDTLREAERYFPRLDSAIAVEPDRRSFKKLEQYSAAVSYPIKAVPAAAYSRTGVSYLDADANRNSHLAAGGTEVALVTLDSLTADRRVDFIKYDVEGAEREALLGSAETIRRDRPSLLVSMYHRSADFFDLPELIMQLCPGAKLTLRRLLCLPAWEVDLLVTEY